MGDWAKFEVGDVASSMDVPLLRVRRRLRGPSEVFEMEEGDVDMSKDGGMGGGDAEGQVKRSEAR